jgi:hypothetical protein
VFWKILLRQTPKQRSKTLSISIILRQNEEENVINFILDAH